MFVYGNARHRGVYNVKRYAYFLRSAAVYGPDQRITVKVGGNEFAVRKRYFVVDGIVNFKSDLYSGTAARSRHRGYRKFFVIFGGNVFRNIFVTGKRPLGAFDIVLRIIPDKVVEYNNRGRTVISYIKVETVRVGRVLRGIRRIPVYNLLPCNSYGISARGITFDLYRRAEPVVRGKPDVKFHILEFEQIFVRNITSVLVFERQANSAPTAGAGKFHFNALAALRVLFHNGNVRRAVRPGKIGNVFKRVEPYAVFANKSYLFFAAVSGCRKRGVNEFVFADFACDERAVRHNDFVAVRSGNLYGSGKFFARYNPYGRRRNRNLFSFHHERAVSFVYRYYRNARIVYFHDNGFFRAHAAVLCGINYFVTVKVCYVYPAVFHGNFVVLRIVRLNGEFYVPAVASGDRRGKFVFRAVIGVRFFGESFSVLALYSYRRYVIVRVYADKTVKDIITAGSRVSEVEIEPVFVLAVLRGRGLPERFYLAHIEHKHVFADFYRVYAERKPELVGNGRIDINLHRFEFFQIFPGHIPAVRRFYRNADSYPREVGVVDFVGHGYFYTVAVHGVFGNDFLGCV